MKAIQLKLHTRLPHSIYYNIHLNNKFYSTSVVRETLSKNESQVDMGNIPDSEFIQNVFKVVMEGTWNCLSKAQIASRLNPCIMSEILLQIGRHDGNLAWRFFKWVAYLPHYQHATRPYWTIIHILTKNNKFKTAQSLLQSISHKGFLSSPVVLDVMINDYSNLGTNSAVLSMLINSYAQSRMTQDAIQVFYQLGSYGINPTVHSCNILLNSLVKAKLPTMAWKIYREMLCRGIEVDSRTFNVMIHACCKQGDLQNAEELVNQMKKHGFNPDLFTYNSLISLLSKKGMHYEALSIQDTMLEKGIQPDIVTYNTLIHGFCKEGRLRDALKILNEMGIWFQIM